VDRMGLPLVASAAVLTAFAGIRHVRIRTIGIAIAVATTAAAALILPYAFPQTLQPGIWQQAMPVERASTWEFFSWFTSLLFRSWWWSLGWIKYLAPPWWVAITLVVTAAALAGLARRLRRDTPDTRAVVAASLIIAAVQVGAVYWSHFRLATGPQGRFLLPAVVPTLVLVWLGVKAWAPEHHARYAALVLLLVLALLDASAWLLVAMPAYGG
jgi:hypothetical protein